MWNKRLLHAAGNSGKYIAGGVAFRWIALAANIVMILFITALLQDIAQGSLPRQLLWQTAAAVGGAAVVRFFSVEATERMGYLASRTVKFSLRRQIYEKLLRLGLGYQQQVPTAEVVQVSVEGVEQLESYFGAYLPQFFYSILAPVTLFAVLLPISAPAAWVLLVCVPLIPLTIAAVQTFAKKVMKQYWGEYTTLGDLFLENLQGLTTLKIYQTDAQKGEEMNREAERFRKITMRLLRMQLSSITVMDLIAYGGAALGVILALTQYQAGCVTLQGGLTILLLAAEFFIPMRLLGSYFHVAMNGMASSEKIFHLLDLPEAPRTGTRTLPPSADLRCTQLRFSYEPGREILHGVSMTLPRGQLTALVGESGCGKSTVAAILSGRIRGFTGAVTAGGIPLAELREDALLEGITYVGFDSFLFDGTIRDNLLLADPGASDAALWAVLEQVNLAAFLRNAAGLDTVLTVQGGNLSGGQRQRLALARAILHRSSVYIFDEATSNVDVESETEIMEQIHRLAQKAAVLLITHRLANAVKADTIYVMAHGTIAESGRHEELLLRHGIYARLWQTQERLEHFGEVLS